MGKIVVMIGAAGSGKSTIAKLTYPTYEYIASDDLREKLLGDVNDQSQNGFIFNKMFELTVEALKAGKNVVYDATNLSPLRRRNLLKRLRRLIPEPVTATAYCVDTCEELCQQRNQARERKVPQEVIHRQIQALHYPTKSEGFDKIIINHTKMEEE